MTTTLNLWAMEDEPAEQLKREAGARNMTYAQYVERLLTLHATLKDRATRDRPIAQLLTELELAATGV